MQHYIDELSELVLGKRCTDINTIDDVEHYLDGTAIYRDMYPGCIDIMDHTAKILKEDNKQDEAFKMRQCIDIMVDWYENPSWTGAGAGNIFVNYNTLYKIWSKPTQNQQVTLWKLLNMRTDDIIIDDNNCIIFGYITTLIERNAINMDLLFRLMSKKFCSDVSRIVIDFLDYTKDLIFVVGNLHRANYIISRIMNIFVEFDMFDQHFIKILPQLFVYTRHSCYVLIVECDLFLQNIPAFIEIPNVIAPLSCMADIRKHTNRPIIYIQ